ncbi:MAG: NAD(P)-dependent oxidoreductase, partial [Planctomycetia bacterium]|nr:NAD(P)-dependent oxidoreductase [Planctomycetia bacterium]
MPVILITQPEYMKGKSVLKKFLYEEKNEENKEYTQDRKSKWQILPIEPEEEVFLSAIRESRARLAIIGMKPYSERIYQALSENAPNPDVEPAVLCRFGVGMDNIRYDWAEKWHIQLGNTPGVLNHSVAEHTIWLLGTAAKRFGTAWESFRNELFLPLNGVELYGKKLLIIGFGGIGRETAKIAHFGLGMSVTTFGRRPLEILMEEENKNTKNTDIKIT